MCVYVCICVVYIYIYLHVEKERRGEREREGEERGEREREGKFWKLKWNQATIQHSQAWCAWDRAQQARPGVLSSSTLAAGKVLKSSYSSFFLEKNAMLVPTEERFVGL